jgi:hypothetical protein
VINCATSACPSPLPIYQHVCARSLRPLRLLRPPLALAVPPRSLSRSLRVGDAFLLRRCRRGHNCVSGRCCAVALLLHWHLTLCSYYTPENLPKAEDALAAAAAKQQKESDGAVRQLSPAEAIAQAQAYKVPRALSRAFVLCPPSHPLSSPRAGRSYGVPLHPRHEERPLRPAVRFRLPLLPGLH